jgi:hypothetical protein
VHAHEDLEPVADCVSEVRREPIRQQDYRAGIGLAEAADSLMQQPVPPISRFQQDDGAFPSNHAQFGVLAESCGKSTL